MLEPTLYVDTNISPPPPPIMVWRGALKQYLNITQITLIF